MTIPNQNLRVSGNTIFVYDPKTKKVKEAECKASDGILTIFKQLIANSTNDDPNIRYNKRNNEETSELWRMNEEVFSAMTDSDVYTGRYELTGLVKNPGINGLDLLTKYKTLIEHYTDPNSKGGQDITQDESLAMANKLFDWYKDVKK